MLVSSLRLDVLSGSLSLLCAIKLVFVSSMRLDVTDRLALGTLVSRALLCSQSFSKNMLKSADFPYHSIMIVQLTIYIHCFLHVITLWILCAKSVIIFWKSTILPKQALRQIPRNAVHRKLMIALLIIKKNRRLQKVRLRMRLRMRWRVRWRETIYLEPKITLKSSSLSPCLQIKLNQVSPANKIHP